MNCFTFSVAYFTNLEIIFNLQNLLKKNFPKFREVSNLFIGISKTTPSKNTVKFLPPPVASFLAMTGEF